MIVIEIRQTAGSIWAAVAVYPVRASSESPGKSAAPEGESA